MSGEEGSCAPGSSPPPLPFPFLPLPRTPAQALRSLALAEFPKRCPPPGGEGEGSRPRQAWGEIPRPLPLSPTPPSPLISQCCPGAWGEASAGAWEGGGGDPGREMGGGDSRQPYPVQTPCPSDQPAHPLLTNLCIPWTQVDLTQL